MSIWTPPVITAIASSDFPADNTLFSTLNLPLDKASGENRWQLQRLSGVLSIQSPEGLTQSVDFVGGKSRHRSREAGHGAAPLKKALGISAFEKRHARKPRIVDATGGWGQDAWLMALMKCTVTLIEKNPIVHALLADALARAQRDEQCSDVARRMSLHNDDACNLLAQLSADVIYLDPMYPHRARKKADSKKGMQILQSLLGPVDDVLSRQLLEAAIKNGATRIVVKRPKGATVLEPMSTFSGQLIDIQSPNTRYDVYLQHTD
ncbi:MAG: class I SAM-dependent methyltransferase [Granulosicoccus sp.]